MNAPIPGTLPATFSTLNKGDLFAFQNSPLSARALRVRAHSNWGVRVTWDHGPGTRIRTRIFPNSNQIQVARGGA